MENIENNQSLLPEELHELLQVALSAVDEYQNHPNDPQYPLSIFNFFLSFQDRRESNLNPEINHELQQLENLVLLDLQKMHQSFKLKLIDEIVKIKNSDEQLFNKLQGSEVYPYLIESLLYPEGINCETENLEKELVERLWVVNETKDDEDFAKDITTISKSLLACTQIINPESKSMEIITTFIGGVSLRESWEIFHKFTNIVTHQNIDLINKSTLRHMVEAFFLGIVSDEYDAPTEQDRTALNYLLQLGIITQNQNIEELIDVGISEIEQLSGSKRLTILRTLIDYENKSDAKYNSALNEKLALPLLDGAIISGAAHFSLPFLKDEIITSATDYENKNKDYYMESAAMATIYCFRQSSRNNEFCEVVKSQLERMDEASKSIIFTTATTLLKENEREFSSFTKFIELANPSRNPIPQGSETLRSNQAEVSI